MPDKELREELIKKLSVPEHICKGEAITFVDWLLDKYYVIKKENAEVIDSERYVVVKNDGVAHYIACKCFSGEACQKQGKDYKDCSRAKIIIVRG
jgi:hypothetical protein